MIINIIGCIERAWACVGFFWIFLFFVLRMGRAKRKYIQFVLGHGKQEREREKRIEVVGWRADIREKVEGGRRFSLDLRDVLFLFLCYLPALPSLFTHTHFPVLIVKEAKKKETNKER